MIDNQGGQLESGSALRTLRPNLPVPSMPLHFGMGSRTHGSLSLWRTLTHTVKKWTEERPPADSPDELEVWRLGMLGSHPKRLLRRPETRHQGVSSGDGVGPVPGVSLVIRRQCGADEQSAAFMDTCSRPSSLGGCQS
jgi:hypothetical protein